ncbi:Ni/Fe hydrogenase subunit alpha [Thiohalocapsa halophila]|uniref:Ni/Fe hydrogenase subunit alpha n=1 Tax=Thiohalocapsa halophila TaxID=69359 RepID=A0ABS1CMM9_9GAMM|nr:nickel-dependent hydrogenase large subunit [Thiohalocapsa halophila]MBK1633202.1 Ni/Fe hydrogenase subunit alpha [Thiohalocapsa halophila]
MTEQATRRIEVPVLARVEGEGGLDVTIRDGRIEHLALRIFEPPRLFEQFLVGHAYGEIPELVARICGICPVAYQMSGIGAVERLFDLDPNWDPDRAPAPWVRRMRRLFYCGEWIQSHALHIHLLAAPDFLGFDSAMAMAGAYGEELRRGLALQAFGNRIIELFGARSVHPVGARVGGFWRAPSAQDVAAVAAEAERALPAAEALLRWTAALPLPVTEPPQAFDCVSLRHPTEYPMMAERIVAESGLDISVDDFEAHFTEHQVPHSTALHGLLAGAPYLVGPLARVNLNHDRLHPRVQALLTEIGVAFPSHDVAQSVIARAVEILQAVLEAAEILADYSPETPAHAEAAPRAGIARGASEAPRGLLWHRYDLDAHGMIQHARIVPPTSQNQARIEADLAHTLTAIGLDADAERLRRAGEQVIRNYDPCISCATHFLRLTLHQ